MSMHPYVRPNPFMTHIVNPVVRRLGLTTILTVRGRRSGEARSVPIGRPFVVDGERFLVSGRGDTHWARNLRAAGRGELHQGGRTEAFRAVEVTGVDRDRIVRRYREHLGHAVDAYFREIPDPADHPVFRIDPIADGGARPAS